MPALSVLIIRTALIYLVAGFTLGGLLLVNKAVPFYPGIWRLLPVHVEITLIGWIIQLVIGVAFWMLPRFNREPVRGKEWLVWGAFVGLNAGILLVCAGALWSEISIAGITGRLLELVAIVLFAIHAWPRIRPFGE